MRGVEAALVPVDAAVSSLAFDAYSRELHRIERIQAQMTGMDAACQGYVNGEAQLLQPLRAQCRQGQRALALQLAHWLDTAPDALSRSQRAKARQHLCQLAQSLAEQGDADMAALHDAHSSQTLADKRLAAAAALRDRLGDWLSSDNTQAHAATSPDALLEAARQQWHEQVQTQQAQRAARQAKRAARKAQREPAPAALQEEQAEQEAGATLRSIFRRLASALHPDRASSEEERQRMNALMSEANAAYARQDLLCLLKLQGQAEQVDAQHLERSSAQRLQALTRLLKQQAASLERERQHAQQQWWLRLKLEPGSPLAGVALQRHLEAQRLALANAWQQVDAAVVQTADLTGLKAWLNTLGSH